MTNRVKNLLCLVGILGITILAVFLMCNPNTKKYHIKLGLDLRSGTHMAVKLLETEDYTTGEMIKIDDDIIATAMDVFQRRLNPEGNKEIIIQREGADRLIIEIPEETNVKKAEELVKKVGLLEFKSKDPLTGEWRTGLTGAYLQRNKSSVGMDANGKPYVSFNFNKKGAEIFGRMTQDNLKKSIAIYFDGKEISAPVVQSVIMGGSGQISGENMSIDECENLKVLMNSGSLPVKVEILESMTVDPMLGQESLKASLVAGIIGLAIVCIFMVWYYRVPGLMAAIALLIYTIISLSTMVAGGFVLTLPGIAGFILSIGMAVDANVLIFERLKEELWDGKSLKSSIEIGFKRAFDPILDGHVTTFLGALIIYLLGATTMKGFGLTLMIGTFWSLITATAGTRVLVDTVFLNGIVKSKKAYGE
ncbi:MAG: protein translocase subunit SecD [bacterium]|nr:protein translocase subunit SecD [bacterium]